MRQEFNYHTHTYRCGHASNCPDEAYVVAALEAGFTRLGFSDHAPYPDRSKPSDRMEFDQLDGYLRSISSLKEKYADQLELKLGFEMEYFPEYQEYIEKVLLKNGDYLICGQHYDHRDGLFDYAHGQSSREKLLTYGRLIAEGLHRVPFLYLAHPDYFCAGITDFDETCRQISHQICQAAVDTNTPLEVNINHVLSPRRHYPDGDHCIYPFRKFWEITQHYPLRCLYGFDAHDPTVLGQGDARYAITDEILQGLDLNFITEPLL